MFKCKKCGSGTTTKSGKVNGKQRYLCKVCGCHFTEGDGRTNEKVALKKAMCIVLNTVGKSSFRSMAKVFNTSPSLTYRWVAESGCIKPEAGSVGETKSMTFKKLGGYLKGKEACFDTSKPLTVASGELWPGHTAIIILQSVSDTVKE
ncbi:MAG: hypothetical protein FWD21_04050 [Peptococcaceae bacterium]|nr:hypothetical protein [Peptococcaceae bacterium]